MMKRSRAFILTEILTGTMLQAGLVLTLCGAFYMTINFYVRTSKILTAREKGQRVISFVDERIRHTGLGLWKCSSSAEIHKALREIPGFWWDNAKTNPVKHLPVVITNGDTWDANTLNEDGTATDGIIKGNILTLLYAQKVSRNDKILLLKTGTKPPKTLSPESNNNEFNLITAKGSSPSKTNNDYANSFNKEGTSSYITSWAVTATAGVPLLLSNKTTSKKQILISADISTKSIDIASGTELLYLKCDRMYIENDDSTLATGRNFAYKKLENNWDTSQADQIERKRNIETGILELYIELDKKTHVLDFYVLASGGYDSSLNNARPKSWPDSAIWKDDYKHHYIYVSRKSWHLDNIPPSFQWN